MKLIRKIAYPFTPIYYAVTWLRNKAYDYNILSSKHYDIPVITVGNLSVGGTGKSPMIEYLIRLLKQNYRLATLSRGYGRNTKGFILADENASAITIGDEPFQFHHKFKEEIIVSVDADRQNGISNLMDLSTPPEVILLDDAYQHRKVKAGFTILLTTYDELYVDDIVLPTGNLREPKIGAKRANIIVVTKCPQHIDEPTKKHIINKLKPLPNQQVYFSSIVYSDVVYTKTINKPLLNLKPNFFSLVTGIANPKPLIGYLNSNGFDFEHINFKDHHEFNDEDVELLKTKSLILTTEKDFMRLKDKLDSENVYYLPIETKLINGDRFDEVIKTFVKNN